MNRLDYNFSEYQAEFNKATRGILKESFGGEFDADEVSDQIDEAQKTYNKIQKILNAPEMIKSHAYLYALDMENVDECDRQKIDKLYELGRARGVIEEDTPEDETHDGEGEKSVDECDDAICGGPEDALTGQEMVPGKQAPVAQSAAFTILYSAMKDGQVKTGEFFSSATDQDSAKADCMSSLAELGYSSIRVLGMEKTNTAVDFGNSSLDEDDSKEFEDQETGAGDTTQQAGKENGETKTEENGGEKKQGAEKQDADNGEETKSAEGGENKEAADGAKNDENGNKDSGENSEEKGSEEGSEEPKKLGAAEKQVLKDEYIGLFKTELQKMEVEKSPAEMSIEEKAKFWGAMSKKWTKQDPHEFMSDAEIEKLNKTVIKVN